MLRNRCPRAPESVPTCARNGCPSATGIPSKGVGRAIKVDVFDLTNLLYKTLKQALDFQDVRERAEAVCQQRTTLRDAVKVSLELFRGSHDVRAKRV